VKGTQACLALAAPAPFAARPAGAPATTDIHNPDPSLRRRTLCGLKIGSGFTLRNPGHASVGMLYDPKGGTTYHGAMSATGTAAGARLELRGYVGISFFGVLQTWRRPATPVTPCGSAQPAS